MFATLFQAKGLSCRVTSLRSRERCSLKGPCSYTQPSKLEHPGPPLSHSLQFYCSVCHDLSLVDCKAAGAAGSVLLDD